MTIEQIQISPDKATTDNQVPLIQIIDDDLAGLISLKNNLEDKGWMVVADTDPQKAISHYFEMCPDCLILNAQLPNKNGFQILEEIQKHNSKIFVPKLLLSSDTSREARMNAYKSGADDFIIKPLDLEELTIRLERHIDRKRTYEQTVLIDELTKVYNKKFLEIELEKSLDDWNRSDYSLTIAVLDLDNFSYLNKRYGHFTGDSILLDFAGFVKENIRSGDTFFRLWGDRFLILFPRTNNQEASEVVNRLLSKYSTKMHENEGQFFNVTFSAGLFEVQNVELTPKAAIQLAERALDISKREGKARVETIKDESVSLVKKQLHISIIDHDMIIRTMLMKVFASLEIENFEINIEMFENGVKFFESDRIEAKGKHFIVMEAVMPIMNGIEILSRVRQLKPRSPLRILMLAGKKDEKEIARALKLGADDYMIKPFSITELKARIERLLQRMM